MQIPPDEGPGVGHAGLRELLHGVERVDQAQRLLADVVAEAVVLGDVDCDVAAGRATEVVAEHLAGLAHRILLPVKRPQEVVVVGPLRRDLCNHAVIVAVEMQFDEVRRAVAQLVQQNGRPTAVRGAVRGIRDGSVRISEVVLAVREGNAHLDARPRVGHRSSVLAPERGILDGVVRRVVRVILPGRVRLVAHAPPFNSSVERSKNVFHPVGGLGHAARAIVDGDVLFGTERIGQSDEVRCVHRIPRLSRLVRVLLPVVCVCRGSAGEAKHGQACL